MMMSVPAFLLALAILIVVHEYGHYRVARACGVKVLRFSVGFGRVIWRRQAHPDATEFTLSMLPLGGYVRMLDEREAPVPADMRGQAFNNKPLWQRAAVVAAGPIANLLLAVAMFSAVAWLGQEQAQPVLGAPAAGGIAEVAGMRVGDRVQASSLDGQTWTEIQALPDLHWQLTQAITEGRALHLLLSDTAGHGRREIVLPLDQLASRELDAQALRKLGLGAAFSEPVLGRLTPGGAGEQAGLREGDRVLSVDGIATQDAASLREQIRRAVRDGEALPMQWTVSRAGQVLSLEVRPRLVEDGGQRLARIEALVGSRPQMVLVREGLLDGLTKGARRSFDVASMTLRLFGRMLTGEASLKNLSGPLTIADYAGQSASLGLVAFLNFLGLVSVSLAVLNLLPLPMLDGGHLMYYLFEGLSGRPVSEWWLKQLQRAGAFVMLLMMALALSNDMTRLLGLH
ncbi:RIP metalloprotease RseP [Paucibacter sp. APW11]|uniref:Zinc metalloprotease n=1 Tax=Roseateles aquae TaxID=3077235 RepID=A0ABU3P7E9_9BURK|nr:RIP metalloprotease RseP [Paucibacter sp. APW11]MDT8998496.1 RIP metalloprotease RseP [Paucibacter sp. APW11]